MTWADIFDLVRHVAELIFYVVTGPLLSIFALKQLRRQRRLDHQLFEIEQRLRELQARSIRTYDVGSAAAGDRYLPSSSASDRSTE